VTTEATSEYDLLRTLTHEQALEYVGQTFRMMKEGQSQGDFELTAAERLLPNRPRSKRMKRDPFSLYFLGPAEPLFPQAMYDLESDAVKMRHIFLVPLGRGEDGRYEYEAVFT
jgi:uncharacterized protein YoaH (UPF0181 family)